MSLPVAILLRVASSPVVRIWAGVGDQPIPADGIEDVDGAIYKGLGTLSDLPVLSQLINGVAARAEFTLSGVPAEILDLADEDAALVRDARCNLGYLALDEAGQPAAPVWWMWEGEADVIRCQSTPDDEPVRSVTLGVGTLTTDRSRANFTTFTPANQRRRSPTDLGCDFVPSYSIGSTKRWT